MIFHHFEVLYKVHTIHINLLNQLSTNCYTCQLDIHIHLLRSDQLKVEYLVGIANKDHSSIKCDLVNNSLFHILSLNYLAIDKMDNFSIYRLLRVYLLKSIFQVYK